MKRKSLFKMTRTLFPLLLAFLMVFLAVPFAASAEEETEAMNYPDELLARFSAFDAATKIMGDCTPENYAARETKAQNKSIVRGTGDAIIVADDASGPSGGLVLQTQILFTKDSTVTIEFYVKMGDALYDANNENIYNLYFGIMSADTGDAVASRQTVGFAFREASNPIGWLNGWNIGSQAVNTFTWNTDENTYGGYTRCVMTYSNYTAALYVGDSSTPAYSHDYSGWTWGGAMKDSLFLVFGVHGKTWNGTSSTLDLADKKGMTVANLRDVAVYNGNFTPAQIDELYRNAPAVLRFEKADGSLVEKRQFTDGSMTVESFPEIESDKTVCWFNKTTGELVQAPATFNQSAILVAREYGINESILIGAQNAPATAGGKANVRFIGGVWNLNGSNVGFEIQVRYKNADGEEVADKHLVMGSTVYTGIIAAGDTCSANELGAMYLFAFSLDEIPAEGNITIEVKTFKQTKSGLRIYNNDSGIFYMENGVFINPPSASAGA